MIFQRFPIDCNLPFNHRILQWTMLKLICLNPTEQLQKFSHFLLISFTELSDSNWKIEFNLWIWYHSLSNNCKKPTIHRHHWILFELWLKSWNFSIQYDVRYVCVICPPIKSFVEKDYEHVWIMRSNMVFISPHKTINISAYRCSVCL